MTTNEIREKYFKFFESKGHKIIPPAPLVLENDPTTLFTSSGMQPLVPYLMGEIHPEGTKLVDSQPSIRLEDIDEVGDNRHTTFFEMLGNWSLGDYFKKEQLPWIWEFLTEELGLSKEKLYVSIFEGNEDVPRDEESYEIWRSLGVPEDHIFEYGVKKNWWSRSGTPEQMPEGEIGGPDSEIFFEFDSVEHNPKFGEKCHPNCDCGRFLEIGNSVFIQYKKENGKLVELPQKNVDFGGGLERLAAVSIDSPDIFKIDIFRNVISNIENLTKTKYENENMQSMQIIADHLRAACFLIADGVEPSNKLQGYILRRLIRRAVFRLRSLDFAIEEGAISTFAKSLKDDYEQIAEKWYQIKDTLNLEAVKFAKSLDKGYAEVKKLQNIDGKVAFDLFQTYGFPLELTLELTQEKGQEVDIEEFKKAFAVHQDKSRTASAGTFKGGLADHSIEVTRLHTAHHLLLAALQQLIDPNISQKGSNINAERLRIDFNFDRKLTDGEIENLEELINEKIDEDLPVTKKIMSKSDAEKIGAQMEFSKKYPDMVSVYAIGPTSPATSFGASAFSLEFCGGPHVTKLSELGGHVTITKQDNVGGGVRRIYAEIK